MKVIDGCTACANMAYNFSDLSFIYPITPSSPIATQIDNLASQNKLNMFGDTVNVVEMQSEAGAAGAMHGALSAGSLATTFTASQGLLLMIPNMYKMAGEMLPAVIHVASRSLATHALSIFGDHQDIYATRSTGFCLLASTNVEDAYNLALVAHLSAIKSSLPFLHFFDGFRTSHEYNMINEIDEDTIYSLLDQKKIEEFRKRSLNSEKQITKGTAQNEDIYFQVTESRNEDYLKVPDIVNEYMQKVNKIQKKDYKPFNYYGPKNAKYLIVAMGSVSDTIKHVVDNLEDLGLIEVHLYRPFSQKYLENVLPDTIKRIAVLDRTKEHGSIGEPLYLDVLSSLKDKNIKIIGGRYGLSSKNTTPNDIYDVYMNLKGEMKNNFTVGIVDDVTNTSLKHYDFKIDNEYEEFKIYGFGSDGLVSASKDIMKILGQKKYVQGYYEYDSKKSGGVTISHLRISNKLIKAPYYATNPKLVVVTKDEYFNRLDMISNLSKNGTLLINTIKTSEELNKFLPLNVKEYIKSNNIKVYIINAEELAVLNGIKGKISLIMETIILKLMTNKNYESILIKDVKERFKTKGKEVINGNISCIKKSFSYLKPFKINDELTTNIKAPSSIYELINNREGDSLKVSELKAFKDGTMPGGTTDEEKRKMSNFVAKWDKTECIECGMCAMVCPHASIRPFLLNKGNKYFEECKNSVDKEHDYIVSVSEADCTGCTLCKNICPKKCINMGTYDESKQQIANDLFNNQTSLQVPLNNIKNIAMQKPLFAFSGACAGCGETPYIKLLTQIVGPKLVIANATGCSSIYGASCPSTPYKVSWANSLFEDNAEFGYGILKTYDKMFNRIIMELKDHNTKESQKLIKYIEENKKDTKALKEIMPSLEKLVSKDLLEYLTPKSVWTIGGDGWAYDIGFGGLDHVLSSNDKAKILVLDTEVYSNTGGQSSKSSRVGQVAQFASIGKKTSKKDLFKIAMNYPNIYIAQISLGANMFQAINAIKEAEEHDGPALIIAYAPCIEHGIKGGMANSISEEKLAVEAGYVLLMRYKDNKLLLDSKEPQFDKYDEFLDNEVRYNSLKIKNKKIADELLEINKTNAITRYNYYKELSSK